MSLHPEVELVCDGAPTKFSCDWMPPIHGRSGVEAPAVRCQERLADRAAGRQGLLPRSPAPQPGAAVTLNGHRSTVVRTAATRGEGCVTIWLAGSGPRAKPKDHTGGPHHERGRST